VFENTETAESPEVATEIPVDGEADLQMETDLQVADAVERLQQIESIQPDVWQSLDSAGRLEGLQSVETQMAAVQGRPELEVTPSDLGPSTYGAFDGERLLVNANDLEGVMPVGEFVDTIVHEGRHAYQQFAVQNPGTIADSATLAAWADNMQPGGYLSAEMYGQEAYESQPIEADAWAYAGRITGRLTNIQPARSSL
jgi:hypothetical protein